MSRTSSWLVKALAALILCVLAAPGVFAKNKDGRPSASDKAQTPTQEGAPREVALPNEVIVSDRDFNHFVFPAAISQGPILPAGAPILGKPVYLAGNTQLLLQLAPGADRPFNMIVELANGSVYKFWLRPRPIPGITHRVDGAVERGRASRSAGESASPRGADVELLKRVVRGELPEEFDAVTLPPPTRFDKFTVVPLSGWSDHATRRIASFALVAVPGQSAVVAPPQFYRPGITAVLIDGDVVDATSSPTLYVIEEIDSDE